MFAIAQEGGVLEVGVVVVAAGLAYGIGRVGNDDADVECTLRKRALAVRRESQVVIEAAVFGHMEGVGEDDPVEGHVGSSEVVPVR